jgi:hypothetical protein
MILNDDDNDNDDHSDSDEDDNDDANDNYDDDANDNDDDDGNDYDDDDDDDDNDISIQRSGGPIHRAAADQHIPVFQRDDDIEAE